MKNLFLLLLCLSSVVLAQSVVLPKKLSATQKKQYNAFLQIRKQNLQNKGDSNEFFRVFFGFIAESTDVVCEAYQKGAEKNQVAADNAYNQGNVKAGEKFSVLAKSYSNLANCMLQINQAYEKKDVGKITTLLKAFVNEEEKVRKAGATPYPRPWLTAEECRMLLAIQTRKQGTSSQGQSTPQKSKKEKGK